MRDDSPILVLRLSAFGDVLHTLPAVSALRATFPDAQIGWVVERAYRELVETVAGVDRVFPLAMRPWSNPLRFRDSAREVSELRDGLASFTRGGRSVDFQGLAKSAIFGVLAAAGTRYGFNWKAVREKPAALLTNRRIDIDLSGHVIDWNLQLAAGAGADISHVAPLDFSRFAVSSPAVEQAVAARPVVLNPGAGRPGKLWPAERFVALARRLAANGIRSLVTWGPGEQALAEGIARAADVELAPPTTLRQLAFLLSRVALVVSGDTGPLHLAAAMDVPVVALFGPTNPRRNGPWHQLERCVETWSGSRDMKDITVDAVLSKVGEVLG